MSGCIAGDVLPAVQRQLLTRLTRLDGSDLSWETGPSSVDVQRKLSDQRDGLTGELLGGEVEISTFSGVANDADSSAAILVFLARHTADDVAIAAGVLDTALEDAAAAGPVVGEEGYIGPDSFAGGLSMYVDLLPHYQIRTGPRTTTTTPTPTQTPTPTSGSGTVTDDFEDGDTAEYRQTGLVNTSVVSTPAKHGSSAFQFTDTTLYGIESPRGSTSSSRLPSYPHLGDQFRTWFRFDGSPSVANGFTMEFGRDASGATHQTYANRQSNNRNVGVQAVAGGADSVSAALSNGNWYALDVSWGPSDIQLELLDRSNSVLGSASISSNGDNGDDHVKFKADVNRQDNFYWDYAHVVGPSR